MAYISILCERIFYAKNGFNGSDGCFDWISVRFVCVWPRVPTNETGRFRISEIVFGQTVIFA